MSRWRVAVVSVSVGLAAYLGQFDRRALGQAGLDWLERAQRWPRLELFSAQPAARAGAQPTPLTVRARVVEVRQLPVNAAVVSLAEQGATLWLGTFDEGLFESAGGALTRWPQVDARINQLTVGDGGRLFAATNGGAFELRDGHSRLVASGPFLASAWWQHQLWLTSRSGLSVLGPAGLWTHGASEGFAADTPAVLEACGAQLCVGAVDGLWRYDGARVTHQGSADGTLPTEWVTGLAFDGAQLHVGTFDAGLAELGELPERRIAPRALAVTEGLVVAGTPTGLLVVRGGRSALVTQGLPARDLSAVVPAREGGVWVGFRGGAARVELDVDPAAVAQWVSRSAP